MNQALLHAEILLRHRAWERESHVEEGRVLRALEAPATERAGGQESSATWRSEEPSGLGARVAQLWRGLRLPAHPQTPRAICPDSPL